MVSNSLNESCDWNLRRPSMIHSKEMIMKKYTIVFVILCLGFSLQAQTDSLQVNQEQEKIENTDKKKQRKDRKRRDEFKVFAGINLNKIELASQAYESDWMPGYSLGFSYKRGRFFYWEIGARYNNPIYNLIDPTISPDSTNAMDNIFGLRNIDVPITAGINILSITSRIVGLRLFVSAVPTFTLGVASNDLGIEMEHVNNFTMYGQGGLGLDVAFLYLETGLNYGFTDMLANDIPSQPYQLFLNLGFRF